MQFLGTTIPPVCVCHSINSKKCTQARNRHHNQDIQHSHHPQKFLHSSWQAFPLHDSQPLSVTDLYSFTFSRLPYKQNYGVCCILCLYLLSIGHWRSVTLLHVSGPCPSITEQHSVCGSTSVHATDDEPRVVSSLGDCEQIFIYKFWYRHMFSLNLE